MLKKYRVEWQMSNGEWDDTDIEPRSLKEVCKELGEKLVSRELDTGYPYRFVKVEDKPKVDLKSIVVKHLNAMKKELDEVGVTYECIAILDEAQGI